MKVISIILTTYNAEKTIQRTLDSIFNQEGLNVDFSIELLIVDDCSTDNTKQIIENNNIEYFTTSENSGGPNKGRNIGLAKAIGDFICIMDHDDEWLPGKISSQLAASELAPIISCGYTEVNDNSGKTKDYVNKSNTADGYNYYSENATFLDLLTRYKKGQKTYIGGLMIHKSLKGIYFEEEYAMVDFDWGLKLFHDRTSVEICKPSYIRHISGSNLSLNENYRINDYKYSLKTIENYKEKYPKQIGKFYKRINGTMGRYYYHLEDMKKARKYFFKSYFNIKILAYIMTSFYGYKYIKKRFRVF